MEARTSAPEIAFKGICVNFGTSRRRTDEKEQAPEVPVRFYRSAKGREPVLEWLRSLDREDRRAIGLTMRVQSVGLSECPWYAV